jgi:hypothetical protein
MANVINRGFLHLPESLAQRLAVTTPETLDEIEKYGDLLQKVGNMFKGNLESISVVAAHATLAGSVKTLKIRLRTGWSIWVRDAASGGEMAIFFGSEITREVKWFDPRHAGNSLLAQVGKVSGNLVEILELGERICAGYETVSGALKMFKGLTARDLSGSLSYLQGALEVVGAYAPTSVSLAITWVYADMVDAAAKMIRGIERSLIVGYLDNLLSAANRTVSSPKFGKLL